MGKMIQLEGAKQFPALDALLAYFHQDCNMYGGKLEDVVNEFNKDARAEPEALARLRADIARFIAARPDDAQLAADFERMFEPDVIAEGWELGITNWRQWLMRVADLLVETPRGTNSRFLEPDHAETHSKP